MAYAGKAGDARRIRALPNSTPQKPLAVTRTRSRPIGALATGLAIGLVVGAGVALLFAPQPGSDTRHDISRRLRRARRRGHDAWDDLRDELGHARRRLNRTLRLARTENLAAEVDES
jgi:YtxH-like protein